MRTKQKGARTFLLLLFIVLSGCATAMPVTTEPLSVQKVIDLPGLSKIQIYEKSKMWMAVTFKSSKAVIEYDNKEEGTIIGNGMIQRPQSAVNIMGTGNVLFTLREDMKDEKARLSFDNFYVTVPTHFNTVTRSTVGGEYPLKMQGDWDGTKEKLAELTESLRLYLISNKTDNW